MRLALLNELDSGHSLADTSSGRFVDGMIFKDEAKTVATSSAYGGKRLEEIHQTRKQRKKLFRLNKEKLKTFSEWCLQGAGAGAAVGAGFCASPLVLHVGLPILSASAVLGGLGLVTGLAAS